MIQGMTGYGRFDVGGKLGRILVEVRSVNHRHFECSVNLPRFLSHLEDDIRKELQARLVRGKVSLSVNVSGVEADGGVLSVDEKKLSAYVKTLKKIAKKFLLKSDMSIETLLALPHWWTIEAKEESRKMERPVRNAITQALNRLCTMRLHEGVTVRRDMLKRVGLIEKAVDAIEQKAKQKPETYREELLRRIRALDTSVQIDPDRLNREVAFQADRLDITEEVVRARHHLKFIKENLSHQGEAGKKIDFMLQELNREINTMASKSQSADVSKHVVLVKSELEKMREQTQNIV